MKATGSGAVSCGGVGGADSPALVSSGPRSCGEAGSGGDEGVAASHISDPTMKATGSGAVSCGGAGMGGDEGIAASDIPGFVADFSKINLSKFSFKISPNLDFHLEGSTVKPPKNFAQNTHLW